MITEKEGTLKIALILAIVAMMLVTTAGTVMAAKPTSFTVPIYQAQFQWRAWASFGDWSYVYQDYETSSDFKLTGKVLHGAWDYSPTVSNQEGSSTVYTYNPAEDLWIEHEGEVSYTYEPYYGDYTAVNKFRGYVDFDGTPSNSTFIHGVAYQWIYIYAAQDDPGVTDILPYAQWDEKVGAWLVGFSIYLWDSGTQSYDVTSPYEDPLFPSPFPEPVPASNYNPLGL